MVFLILGKRVRICTREEIGDEWEEVCKELGLEEELWALGDHANTFSDEDLTWLSHHTCPYGTGFFGGAPGVATIWVLPPRTWADR
jgi:hypothetical protein